MRCIIPGRCIKVFGRAVHCLSKIGDELYLEALSHGLALRTVNSSRSAYACFVFSSSFFQSYDDGSDESQEKDLQKCKIAMKSCLSVFKSLNSLERSVDRCSMELDLKECRLIFLLYCHHGITKTYNLTFQECETLQAVFSKDLCPNRIVTPCKVLVDTVMNFPANQEEITMIVSPETLKVKNYLEDEPDPSKVIHTEMTLVPEEFDNYQIGLDTEVTFCLKELRAILSFAESVNQLVNMFFETGGKPIVFCFSGDSTFESDFVLATLVEPSLSQASQATATQSSQVSSVNKRAKKSKNTQNNGSQSVKRQRQNSSHDQPVQSQTQSQTTATEIQNNDRADKVIEKEEDEEDWMMDDLDDILTTSNPVTSEKQKSQREDPKTKEKENDNYFSDSFPYKDLFVKSSKKSFKDAKKEESQENSEKSTYSINPLRTPVSTGRDISHIRSDVMPSLGDSCPDQQSSVTGQASTWNQKEPNTSILDDIDENDMDCVPGTPPSKKFKSMFFNAPSLSQTYKEASTEAMVLAEDTDDESD